MSLLPWLEKLREADVAGFHLINGSLRNWLLDSVMPFITDKWNFALPLGILLLYILLFRPRRDRILAVSAIAVVLLADGTTLLLKNLFHRIRPCDVLEKAVCSTPLAVHLDYASRLANATLFYVKDLFHYATHRLQPGGPPLTGIKLKGAVSHGSFSFPSNHASNMFAIATFLSYNYRSLLIPLFSTAALIGYSRIYLGAHYPADVVAGAVWGMLLGFLAAITAESLTRSWQVHHAVRPAEKENSPVSRLGSFQ